MLDNVVIKYVKAAIDHFEARLAKSDLRLPSKCDTLVSTGYHTSEEVTREMDTKGFHTYQELIGILRLAIYIGRIDIILKVSMLSSHLALPRIGHLLAVYWIFRYLKQVLKRKLYFDPKN